MNYLFYGEITLIGELAREALEDNMMILFNDTAPCDLADYCFIHHQSVEKGHIDLNSTLLVDDVAYVVTAVGPAANINLQQLGHITIKFDGADTPELPGCIHVLGPAIPAIKIGTRLVFG